MSEFEVGDRVRFKDTPENREYMRHHDLLPGVFVVWTYRPSNPGRDDAVVNDHMYARRLELVLRKQEEWKNHFGEFERLCEARLEAGQEEYGDSNFHNSIPSSLQDMEEELLDLANYAFMGWTKVRKLRKLMEEMRTKLGDQAQAQAKVWQSVTHEED